MCKFRIRTILLAAVLGTLPVLAAPQQKLAGHIPPQVPKAAFLKRLDSTNQLRLAISLALRNTNELERLLKELYDPASPNYRRYLTPGEFTARFGPSAGDYEGVKTFCQTNGLSVANTHPNRTVLDVAGSVDAIERLFHTTLQEYRHPTQNRTFFAPAAEPSVDLAIPILHIHGLDNYHRPRSLSKKKPLDQSAAVVPNGGSGAGGAFLGKDFRAAYLPGVTLTGSGQTVALVAFDGYYPNDVTRYEQMAGMSAVPLENILVNSFNGKPGPGNGEVALDIQMAIAMAPGLAKVLIYEESTNGAAIDLLNRVATDNRANQISCSWTWGSYDPGTDQVFQQYAAQGQSFYQAAGDAGAYPTSVDAPADNPYITVVGGTSLTTTSTGNWAGETTWNDGYGDATGGGSSTQYPLPDWQGGLNMSASFGSTLYRNLPDVAMVADNVINVADNGTTYQTIGTSISAPLWAGFAALVNQQAAAQGYPAIGFINPALYTLGGGAHYLAAFHDINTGDNSTSSDNGFPAAANYDLCTGWGSPTGSNTIDLLIQVAYNQMDHFLWAPIASPVANNTSFAVKLTAQSANSNLVSNFNGQTTLSAIQARTNILFSKNFESDSLIDWRTESTSYTLAIDVTTGAANTPNSITLTGGNQDAYDGVSHSLDSITPNRIEFYVKSANNTLTSGYFVAGKSKYLTNSVFHFRMDGTGTMGLTDGPGNFYSAPYNADQWYKVGLQIHWDQRLVDYYVDDSLVMPNIPFCNTNVTSLATLNLYNFDSSQAWWDQISFMTTTNIPVAVSPTTAIPFIDGTWNGTMTISSGLTNLMLIATDTDGHTGVSAPFDVQTNTFATVTLLATPSNGGSVKGGGTYSIGTQQTISATPNSGWGFIGWQDNNTQNPRTITVSATNVTYTAVFVQLPQITNPTLNAADGSFSAVFNGTSGSNYIVLVSTNLKTWAPLTSLKFSGSSIRFTDTNTTAPWKFYQLQAAP